MAFNIKFKRWEKVLLLCLAGAIVGAGAVVAGADLGNLLGTLLGGTSQKQTTTAQADGTELLGLLTGLLK